MKTPEEIIKEKYPFYDENYTNKDVELNGKQVTELMIKYADQFKQVKVEPEVKVQTVEEELNHIAKRLAALSGMPYCWEDILDRLHHGYQLPFKFEK